MHIMHLLFRFKRLFKQYYTISYFDILLTSVYMYISIITIVKNEFIHEDFMHLESSSYETGFAAAEKQLNLIVILCRNCI